MEKFVIEGMKRLEGAVRVHGSKNAVLPMMAASIMNKSISVIENVPRISDVENMLEILQKIGCRCSFEDGILVIDSADASPVYIDGPMASKIRTSVLFCGPMLARFGYVCAAEPGGCAIGSRPIDIHLDAFEKMGVSISRKDGVLEMKAGQLSGIVYRMPFPSVGATQNIMMAALGARGTTVLINAAREPEVCEFGMYLKNMGADIEGLGTDKIVIQGGGQLSDTAFVLQGDRIVAGTYMAACAAAGGRIYLEGVAFDACRGFDRVFEEMGCCIERQPRKIKFSCEGRLNNLPSLETGPFPEFPTDMQSQMMSVMSVSRGSAVLVENIFENRFKNAVQLQKMGADILIQGKRAVIHGVDCIHGAQVQSYDLRGGAALIIAGLAAEGMTVVQDEGFIARGYEDIRRDLCLLGAHIA